VDQGLLGRARDIGYGRARRLVLVVGLGVLAVTAGIMYVRRVDTIEVVGTLFFMVVFVAFVFGKARGGLAAGLLAALAYASLRYPAVQAVGSARFAGLIASRAFGFLAFGALGGWAMSNLEASLTKLEFYDQIDDDTGLYNARFFVQDTDLEMSRSRRYQTIFSIAVADIPAAALAPLGRRQRAGTLRQLGRLIADSVRTVDRAAHGSDEERHRIAIVLPETGREGARIFTERFVQRVADYLRRRGAAITPDRIAGQALTFPDDEVVVQRLRAEFAEIDRQEHPEAAEAGEAEAESA
jgi:GGDEF domain-containing protein